MRTPDVVVVGTGRSGTSTVARILHEQLGVCMGHEFREAQHHTPNLDYEERAIMPVIRHVVGFPQAHVDRDGFRSEQPMAPVLKAFTKSHAHCASKLKGFKATHASGLTPRQWEELSPRLIIRTWRPRKLVVASMDKWRGGGRPYSWGQFYDDRERQMKFSLGLLSIPVVRVEFGPEVKTDEEVADELRRHVLALEFSGSSGQPVDEDAG